MLEEQNCGRKIDCVFRSNCNLNKREGWLQEGCSSAVLLHLPKLPESK